MTAPQPGVTVIHIRLPADIRAKVTAYGTSLGLSTHAAAKVLIAKGLEAEARH